MGSDDETVILVHGLWLHGAVFVYYRRSLARRGFKAQTFSYASVRRGLADNAAALAVCVSGIAAQKIHLVGHSLGGLVILTMLAARPDARVHRVVLLGSPVQGSHCANALRRWPGGAAILGRSIQEWSARTPPAPPPDVEIGVLAGTRGLGLGRLIPGLPRPNDGVVSVAETRLAGCKDAIALPLAHSQMLFSKTCIDQIATFLASGNFSHA